MSMRALKEQKAQRGDGGSYQFDRERQDNSYSNNHPKNIAREILESRQNQSDRGEIHEFGIHLNSRISLQKQALQDWNKLHQDIHDHYKDYKSQYNTVKSKADDNLKKLQTAIDRKNLLASDFSLNLEKLTADLDSELVNANNDWISSFTQGQTAQFNTVFHNLASKVSQQRLSSLNLDKRKKVEDALKALFSQLDKAKSGQQADPFIKHDLLGLAKKITELQHLDQIVPGILEDLKSKPDEYVKNLKPVFGDFLTKLGKLSHEMEELVVKDSSYKDLYKSLESEDPNQIRASKYGMHIVNSDLVALKQSRPPLKVLEFYLHYLSDKLALKNQQAPEGEKLFLAETIYDVHGQEGSILKELSRNTLLKTTYKRVGIVLSVANDHYVLVELLINSVRGLKELCIYDSNVKEYQHMQSKIYTLFRDLVGEADVAAMSHTGSWFDADPNLTTSKPSFMRIKHVNCPQILSRNDSALYALKNAQLFTENLRPGQGSYSAKDMETFRYDVFAAVAKSKFSDVS